MTRVGGGLREQHKQTTRRPLVDSALRLFDERGYGVVTVEDICAEARVSPRTFFRYFPTKEHVLAEPITVALDAIRDRLRDEPRTAAVWPALRGAVLAAADVVEERSEEFLRSGRVIRETPGALASSARALMEWEQDVRDEVADRLGGDDPMYPRLLLGTSMLALRAALDQWTTDAGAQPIRGLVEAALDAVDPGAKTLERAAKPTAAAH